MLSFLKRQFLPVIYLQLSPDRISVRNASSGREFSCPPELAITQGPKPQLRAFGAQARLASSEAGVTLVRPFSHPRTLVGDFTAGEQLLRACIREVLGKSLFALSPRIVVHPRVDPEGGFTQIEIRALHEMALGSGASEVRIWHGRLLSDAELLSDRYLGDGRLLQ